MPVNQESLNKELYGILKSRGYRPDMYTSAGKKVAIPDEAEVFQFDFIKDGTNYGKVHVTIDGLHRLVIYYGDDVESSPKADSHDSQSFSSLLQHMKRWAKNKQLGFELSDQDDLEADMAKREHNKREGLNEGYYPLGKMKSYSDNVPTTKIILQHNRQIEEGEQRYRNIAKIFVENINGERFLLPTTKPGLARVYARHVAEGGTPYDERGQHITSLCEEYGKMAGFVRATKNKQFNESAQPILEAGMNHYNNLRETLHKMAGKRGYREYFENYKPSLLEDEGSIDLSEMFTQTTIDPRIESVMPILSKLTKNITEAEVSEVKELEEWASGVLESSIQANTEKQRYEQGARDVLKGADFDHIARIRKLDPEILRKHVDYAWGKVNSGEYKLNRPNLEEGEPGDLEHELEKQEYERDKKRDDEAEKELNKDVKEVAVHRPGEYHSPATQAITRRILMTRTDLLAKYGPEKVGQAIDEIADGVGDVEEIGTSDVSGWVRQVEGLLSGMNESEKIGGLYDPDDFDDMVLRVKKKAKEQEKKKPVDLADLARRLQAAMKKDEKEQPVKEAGPAGKPGDYFDAEQKVSTGPILGNKLQSQKGLRGKLVGESEEVLDRIKKLSGLEK